MARIEEETVTLTFSKIVKTGAADETSMISEEILTTLETVAQELVGNNIVVEVTQK